MICNQWQMFFFLLQFSTSLTNILYPIFNSLRLILRKDNKRSWSKDNFHELLNSNQIGHHFRTITYFKGMSGDMSGVRTRQRKLLFVPGRADGPSLSINIHTYTYITSMISLINKQVWSTKNNRKKQGSSYLTMYRQTSTRKCICLNNCSLSGTLQTIDMITWG
jgi:hypothetical protein